MSKWHTEPPDQEGKYIVTLEDGTETGMEWCGGWNCKRDPITGEIYKYHQRFDVVKWAESKGSHFV